MGYETNKKLEGDLPPENTITSILDRGYLLDPETEKDTKLDVYYPASSEISNPTLIWIHGGGWISGNKNQIANYLKILASKNFTVVGVNYSIAPKYQYPLALKQVNEAIKYLLNHALDFKIDPTKLGLAGDSAGSQIAAQIATLYTNNSYKGNILADTGFDIGELAELPVPLNAIVLCCGGYNLETLVKSNAYNNKIFRDFIDTVIPSYSGYIDPVNQKEFKTFSVYNYIDPVSFPKAFITAGDADPLYQQSIELASKLYPSVDPGTSEDMYYPPELSHEYQFELHDTGGHGKAALERIVTFLNNNLNK